jgi:hypothetical protein
VSQNCMVVRSFEFGMDSCNQWFVFSAVLTRIMEHCMVPWRSAPCNSAFPAFRSHCMVSSMTLAPHDALIYHVLYILNDPWGVDSEEYEQRRRGVVLVAVAQVCESGVLVERGLLSSKRLS